MTEQPSPVVASSGPTTMYTVGSCFSFQFESSCSTHWRCKVSLGAAEQAPIGTNQALSSGSARGTAPTFQGSASVLRASCGTAAPCIVQGYTGGNLTMQGSESSRAAPPCPGPDTENVAGRSRISSSSFSLIELVSSSAPWHYSLARSAQCWGR